jgi:aminoglycoside 6'-N-acetyltransferase
MAACAFRHLTREDFPLLGDWLSQPHVARWWAADPSPDAIEADYGGSVDGTEPSEVFIASRGGTPLGLVQRYRWDAYPSYVDEVAAILTLPAQALSIDYLVGPPAALQRGWGTQMLREFVQSTWRDLWPGNSPGTPPATCPGDPQTPAIVVPVHADNTASWRVLERAGFRRVASGLLVPDNPADNRNHHIYRLDRPAPA